jgi:pimeloyl-ACP methyl ester carboxylesterase
MLGALALVATAGPAIAQPAPGQPRQPEIGYFTIDRDITVRRMIFAKPKAKGTVLLLHGFPETLYAWQDVARPLAADFEVHAFDWPGFGLSSRPPAAKFAYSPRDYAGVLKRYIEKAGIDRSKLTIYATDIGALPALLLALDEPAIARRIIVGDFAPFDRPQHMYSNLQSLKSPATAERTRAAMNASRDEILRNAFRRGVPAAEQFEVSAQFEADMFLGWDHGAITSADAFHHYYAAFTRDQNYLEANLGRLRTPVKVVWGEKDIYIDKEMGVEFASRIGAEFALLPGLGHYSHLHDPERTVEEVRASFR